MNPREGRDGGGDSGLADGGIGDGGRPDGDGGSDGGLPEEDPIGSVTISPMQGDLVEGGTASLRATVRDKDGEIITGHAIAWNSMAPEIAEVDEATGIVTGVSAGSAWIRATSGDEQGLVQVTVLEAITEAQLALGSVRVCGLSRAGRAYCWKRIQFDPKLVSETLRFTTLVGGSEFFAALTPEGKAYTWGLDSYGALGTGGTMTFAEEPQPVSGDHTFRSISAGTSYVVALTPEGEAYAWGFNDYGQLGIGSDSDSNVPVRVGTSVRFTQVAAWYDHTLGLTADGEVYSWGKYGDHLGVLTGSADQLTPIAVPTTLEFAAVAAGRSVSYALTRDGDVYGWGNVEGVSIVDAHVPRPLSEGKNFQSMPGPGLAIDEEGKLYSWGDNGYGQVGDGTFERRDEPVAVEGDYEFSVVARSSSGCPNVRALHEDGLFGWGCPDSSVPPTEDANASPHPLAVANGHVLMAEGITVARGGTMRVPVSLKLAPGDFNENGPVYDPEPVALTLITEASDGVSVMLEPATIPEGQTSAILAISVASSAPLGSENWIAVNLGDESSAGELQVVVVPPAPPPGTPLNLRCDGPDTLLPEGFHCLTNSGGATAPHNYRDLGPLAGTTWNYENLCISYGRQGRGEARFRNPSGTITAHPLRYGVLSRSSGMPEVTTTGHWLLYNEGIGDPQVEQLTYHPGSKKVGEAWPFSSAGCPF